MAHCGRADDPGQEVTLKNPEPLRSMSNGHSFSNGNGPECPWGMFSGSDVADLRDVHWWLM